MNAYASDRRVQPHPDGSWMVFADDALCTEYNVLQLRDGGWAGFDAHGIPIESSFSGSMDDTIRDLIGPPR